MKHEYFNTIIAGLALLLALFTTWNQMRPVSDDVLIDSSSALIGANTVSIDDSRFPSLDDREMALAGPVIWSLDIINTQDRNVVVTGLDVFLLTQEGSRAQYSSMVAGLWTDQSRQTSTSFPLNISARQGVRTYLGLNVPIASDPRSDANCAVSGYSLFQIQRCFFASGRDLFGNSFTAGFYRDGELQASLSPTGPADPPLDVEFIGTYDGPVSKRPPRYLAIITTSDGSQFLEVIEFSAIP